MKIKSQRDFLSGVMFVVTGCAFAIGSTNYQMGSSARPGAGFFPLILSVLMALLGLFVLYGSFKAGGEDDGRVGAIAWRPLLVVVLAIAVFGATINVLGLALAVPLLIVLTSLAGREFQWLGVAISAVVLTVFSWFVFVFGLKLTIPVWPTFLAA